MNQPKLRKYIYEWLESLGLGPVFQDRRPLDDTTLSRDKRTYIVYFFQDGIIDEGPWYHGLCTVIIGCRDIKRFTAALKTLDDACEKFQAKFDYNDELNGISMIDLDEADYESDGDGNHECVFVFDVYAKK